MIRNSLTLALAASLALAACASNRPPAPQTPSHPPAADLRCLAEPNALSEAEASADNGDAIERDFNDGTLLAGRSCRDALGRVCRWHKERGDPSLICDPLPNRRPGT